VSAGAAFGSLVVERFLDGVVLLLFFVLAALSPGFPGVGAFSEGWVFRGALLLVLGILVVIVVMAAWPQRLIRVGAWAGEYLPKRMAGPAVSGLEKFLKAIAVVRDVKLLAIAFAWTVFFWTWHAMSFWLGMLAFGIDTGFVSAVFVEAVVGFGVAVPAAPGFIGTFHASAKFALSDVYGVPDGSSLAFAFGYHFGGWIPITLIGLWYAWKLGLSLRDVGSSEERVGDA
jgi:uncharacterized membrane protein YbhN (UPF0104 family)